MTFLILVAKGFLIGLAFIIPGVSGGTIAVYLGVYDEMIHAIGHIFSEFKKSVRLLVPIMLGAALAIIGLAALLGWLIDKNSFIVLMLFIGLIIGGIPALLGKIRKPYTKGVWIAFASAFLLVVALIVGDKLQMGESIAYFELNVWHFLLLIILGAAASMTMIVPGISGSALLMTLGFYTAIVTNVVGKIFEFANLSYNLFVVIPFALGIALGVILFSRVIGGLLKNKPRETYGAILGFVAASVIGIFLEIRDPASALSHTDQTMIVTDFFAFIAENPLSVALGILALIAGVTIAFKFLPKEKQTGK